MQDINDVIEMFPEEKYDEVLRRAESIPKRENDGAGIDRLVMFFMGTHTSRGNFFMR